MNELKVKNIGLTGFIILLGAVLTACAVFLSVQPLKMPVYLILSAALGLLAVINLIVYTKANLGQTVKISGVSFIFFALIFVSSGFASNFIKANSVILNKDILKISPVSLVLAVIFSVWATISLLKIESARSKRLIEAAPSDLDKLNHFKAETIIADDPVEIIVKEELKPVKKTEVKENKPSKKEEIVFLEEFDENEEVFEIIDTESVSEVIEVDDSFVSEIDEVNLIEEADSIDEIELIDSFVEDIPEESKVEQPEKPYESDNKGYVSKHHQSDEYLAINANKLEDEPQIFLEDTILTEDFNGKTEVISANPSIESSANVEKVNPVEFIQEVQENQEFLEEEKPENQFESQPKEQLEPEMPNQTAQEEVKPLQNKEQIAYDKKAKEDILLEVKKLASLVNEMKENKYEHIPENLRLNDVSEKKQPEAKGKISSIGKLLINQRDLENIIETNALMQHVSVNNSKTNIINTGMGEELKQKLLKIKEVSSDINDVVSLDAGGFVISSIMSDKSSPDIVGAIASGMFQSINNYLSQIKAGNPHKMFFEASNTVISILKKDDKYLFTSSNKNLAFVDYTLLNQFFAQTIISTQDLESIKSLSGLIEAVITNKDGSTLGSVNSLNPDKTAHIASAIFENMKVLLLGIKKDVLDRITIFTEQKIIIIKKYDDKTAAIVVVADGPVKYSQQMAMIDEIIK